MERDRPVLFEQVARRVINVEELEDSMPSDEERYQAACQSRFNSPETVAVLGDVVSRLRLLKGTRAAVGRRGFGATSRPWQTRRQSDCIVSAMLRPGMPIKVKTAPRTLLLSTSLGTGGNSVLLAPPKGGSKVGFFKK